MPRTNEEYDEEYSTAIMMIQAGATKDEMMAYAQKIMDEDFDKHGYPDTKLTTHLLKRKDSPQYILTKHNIRNPKAKGHDK